MKNRDFYELLEQDLLEIIESFPGFLKNKLKQEQQKKSHAFLIWFLNFYADISNIDEYITDGHDDKSCDIILDRINTQGERVFYLVQSKWNTIGNCEKHFESEVLKSYLSDVNSILLGDVEPTKNQKFNHKYKQLIEHIRANGEVKVIYLSLKNECLEAKENIKSLENSFGHKVKVESFDINRLKLDYIERLYKKSIPPNPLEKIYNPEFEKINLNIVKDDSRNLLTIGSPFEGYVFNVLPKTIFQLVERYGVSLFDKNVRNPLVSSSINTEIVNSLKNNPSYFWYYNNGITAISRKIPPIGTQAESFEVTGLQIINGAQTAYSIYKAYSESTPEQREIIDTEARITLRLLKSGGKDFDLKVTKFTNSQNPVSERDFWSSDELQTQIQNYFYGTNVWYEKRSGEFREYPEQVIKVPNTVVADAHLSFWLGKPVDLFEAHIEKDRTGIDLRFTSYRENPDGLYEVIFNKETDPIDVFSSFVACYLIMQGAGFKGNMKYSNGFHVLALSKIIIEKYISAKYGDSVSLSSYMQKSFINEEHDEIRKCFVYTSKVFKNEIDSAESEEEEHEKVISLMTKKSHFEMLMEKVQKIKLLTDDIESIDIEVIEDEDEDEDKFENFNMDSEEVNYH
ncbi:AIPR family protein [Vibrio parahaemolyticus]|nr:AIPR family protein [Vibrio parahaemolyticus]